jgi:hypothetical protein
MAISLAPYEDREDMRSLVLVRTAEAERFVIGEDSLRVAGGAGKIALGTPT